MYIQPILGIRLSDELQGPGISSEKHSINSKRVLVGLFESSLYSSNMLEYEVEWLLAAYHHNRSNDCLSLQGEGALPCRDFYSDH